MCLLLPFAFQFVSTVRLARSEPSVKFGKTRNLTKPTVTFCPMVSGKAEVSVLGRVTMMGCLVDKFSLMTTLSNAQPTIAPRRDGKVTYQNVCRRGQRRPKTCQAFARSEKKNRSQRKQNKRQHNSNYRRYIQRLHNIETAHVPDV